MGSAAVAADPLGDRDSHRQVKGVSSHPAQPDVVAPLPGGLQGLHPLGTAEADGREATVGERGEVHAGALGKPVEKLILELAHALLKHVSGNPGGLGAPLQTLRPRFEPHEILGEPARRRHLGLQTRHVSLHVGERLGGPGAPSACRLTAAPRLLHLDRQHLGVGVETGEIPGPRDKIAGLRIEKL